MLLVAHQILPLNQHRRPVRRIIIKSRIFPSAKPVKMKYAAMFLLLFAFSASCKKKGLEYTIEGVVTDETFNTPGSGMLVELYETPAGGEKQLKSSMVTGSDGKFSFKVKREKIEAYELVYSKNLYFGKSTSFNLGNLSTKEPNVFNSSLIAKSWVRMIFHNPDDDQDLKVIRTNGITGCSECCTWTEMYFYGTTDSTVYCINNGNTEYSYHWYLLGTQSHDEQSVITVPFDTTDIVFNY